MITAPLDTIPYLIFSVPCPPSPLTYFSSALSSHCSCLHLSFCRLFLHHFFSLLTFVSLILALFILCIFWFYFPISPPFFHPVFQPQFPTSSPPPEQKSSISFILYLLSLSIFFLFTYLSAILPGCSSVKKQRIRFIYIRPGAAAGEIY